MRRKKMHRNRKAGNLYLPSGCDIALMLFRKAMEVIAESVKPIYLAEENEKQIQNNKNQDSEKAKENLKPLKAELKRLKMVSMEKRNS